MKRAIAFIGILLLCTTLTGCISKEAKSVQEMIDSLPEAYDASTNRVLNEAHKAYDALPDKDKNKIDTTRMDQLDQRKVEHLAEVKAERERIQEEDKYKAEAGKVNDAIKNMRLSAKTVNDFKKSVDSYNSVMRNIATTSIQAEDYIEYNIMQSKIDAMLSEAEALNDRLTKDKDAMSEVSELNDLFADSLGYAMNAFQNGSKEELDNHANTCRNYSKQILDDLNSIKTFDVSKSQKAAKELYNTANTGGLYKDWLHNMIEKSTNLSIALITDSSNERDVYAEYEDALKSWRTALEDSGEILEPRGHKAT